MKKLAVSAIVLAHNEENMLPGCIKTLSWCKEVIVIDDGSTDRTPKIAEDFGARLISFKHHSFARRREEGAKHAKTDWLLYIDSDERVTPLLMEEIRGCIDDTDYSAYQVNRENIFYGKSLKHGGWEHDFVTRLIHKKYLLSWNGDVHESPKVRGNLATLQSPLLHFSHRSVRDGLKKTLAWTATEAQLLAKATQKKVSFYQIVKKGLGEFWRRAIIAKGYQDGSVGLIESLTQAINRMLVYMQVWELQQTPPIEDLYLVKEREVEILWEQSK